MEIFGVNAHIRDVTERVAREGYVALAPDFFHRTGPGVEYGYDDAGFAGGMKLLGGLRADEMIADAKAAIGWLRARTDVRGDRIGAMGFCIGGHMTYLTACETDVRAAASFYGGGIAASAGPGGAPSTLGRTGKIRGKLSCFFGAEGRVHPARSSRGDPLCAHATRRPTRDRRVPRCGPRLLLRSARQLPEGRGR